MMSPYRVFVRIEAAEVIRTIGGPERRAITSFVTKLSKEQRSQISQATMLKAMARIEISRSR